MLKIQSLWPISSQQFLASLGIPYFGGLIKTASCQAGAIRVESNARYPILVADQCQQFLASLTIPYLSCVIVTGSGNPRSIRAVCDVCHNIGMADKTK